MVITTHNENCYTEICLAFLDDAFVNNCTFILFNENEIIYHQETSMLRSLSTDTITHTTNQPDKETTSKPTLLEYQKSNSAKVERVQRRASRFVKSRY